MSLSKILSENTKQIVILLGFVSLLIIIDQATKALAEKYLENSPCIVIIPNFISLNFIRNKIAHLPQYIFYFLLSIVVVPAVIFYTIEKSMSRRIIVGLALLWSAVISNNLIDVFTLGYIRDFIKLHGVATGNIADQYRTIGLVVIIAGLLIKDERRPGSKVLVKLFFFIFILLALLILYWKYIAKHIPI